MKRCLVIDDSRVIRRVAAKIVQDLGFAPEEAASGQDALAACKAAMPDVVLMEWDMMQIAGPDLARALRALPGGGARTALPGALRLTAPMLAAATDGKQPGVGGTPTAVVRLWCGPPGHPPPGTGHARGRTSTPPRRG